MWGGSLTGKQKNLDHLLVQQVITLMVFCIGDKCVCVHVFLEGLPKGPLLCVRLPMVLLRQPWDIPSSAPLPVWIPSLPLCAPCELLPGAGSGRLVNDRAVFPPQFPRKWHRMLIAFHSALQQEQRDTELGFAFPQGAVGVTDGTEPEEFGKVADCKGNNLFFLMMDGT